MLPSTFKDLYFGSSQAYNLPKQQSVAQRLFEASISLSRKGRASGGVRRPGPRGWRPREGPGWARRQAEGWAPQGLWLWPGRAGREAAGDENSLPPGLRKSPSSPRCQRAALPPRAVGWRAGRSQVGCRGAAAAQPTLLLKRRERLRLGVPGRGGGARGRPRTSQRRRVPSCEAV